MAHIPAAYSKMNFQWTKIPIYLHVTYVHTHGLWLKEAFLLTVSCLPRGKLLCLPAPRVGTRSLADASSMPGLLLEIRLPRASLRHLEQNQNVPQIGCSKY